MIFKIDPIGKPRMTQRDKWIKRPNVQKYWDFKDYLCLQAKKEKFELKDNMNYLFYISMPKSWSKKKRKEMQGKKHKQKPDLDNILKAVWDSLLQDDSVISSVGSVCKFWGEDGIIVINS